MDLAPFRLRVEQSAGRILPADPVRDLAEHAVQVMSGWEFKLDRFFDNFEHGELTGNPNALDQSTVGQFVLRVTGVA